jgi:hypothetical protein
VQQLLSIVHGDFGLIHPQVTYSSQILLTIALELSLPRRALSQHMLDPLQEQPMQEMVLQQPQLPYIHPQVFGEIPVVTTYISVIV